MKYVWPVLEVIFILAGFLALLLEPAIEAAIVLGYVAYDLVFFGGLTWLPEQVKSVIALLVSNGLTNVSFASVVFTVLCILVSLPKIYEHYYYAPFFSLPFLTVLFGASVAYIATVNLGVASIIAQWLILVWFSFICLWTRKKPFNVAKSTLQASLPKKHTCSVCQEKSISDPCPSCKALHRREHLRVQAQNLRARQMGAPATLTLAEWLETLKSFGYKCAYCQTKPFQVMEHYRPLPHGGTTAGNCVPGCYSCNSKKSNKLPEMVGK